ncbi:hypothetical protein ACWKTS_32370 [Bacillus toyonensis]|uniref:hypothetical protein n=1 Tax=Bacillus toyonensis TaxID=155322 RepID=UPI000BF029BD|nr:hypothetical protein [Bacillus toyonensis]PEO41629.1 hypothetical protein CN579_34325 [Bacillus toyonensis]
MKIIDFESVKKQKIQEKRMVTLPLISLLYEENGEVDFEVIGEKEVPIAWMDWEPVL